MPPALSFDKDYFFAIMRDNDGLSHYEIAQRLTDYNKRQGRNVEVTVGAIHNAVHKWRPELLSRGIHSAESQAFEWPVIRDLKKHAGVSSIPKTQHVSNVAIRRLRQVSRLHEGLYLSEEDKTKARNWEARMRRERTVVDLTEDGIPYTRPAEAWELDAEGNLLALICQPRPKGR